EVVGRVVRVLLVALFFHFNLISTLVSVVRLVATAARLDNSLDRTQKRGLGLTRTRFATTATSSRHVIAFGCELCNEVGRKVGRQVDTCLVRSLGFSRRAIALGGLLVAAVVV